MGLSFWFTHRTKKGETLDSILKKYRIKNKDAVLKYPGNKKRLELLKSGGPLPERTMIYIPNPDAQLHVFVGIDGKEKILDDKQFKDYTKEVHAVMDRMGEALGNEIGYAADRQDFMRKLNKEQRFVSSVVGIFSSVDEPKKSRQEAEAAQKALMAVIKSRNYAQFQAASDKAEAAIVKYQNDVNKWTGDLIGTAEGTVKNLKRAKSAGKFAGTLAVVTITAPASLGTAILIGGLSNSTVGLTYDGFDQIGRAGAGVKPRSHKELATRFVTNFATGAAGAFLGGLIIKAAGSYVVGAILSKSGITKLVNRLSSSALINKVFQREADNVVKELVKSGGGISRDQYMKILTGDRLKVTAITKFLIRAKTGGLIKYFEADKKSVAFATKWLKNNPDKLDGKDENAVAAAMAKDFAASKEGEQMVEEYLRANQASFGKLLKKEMEVAAKAVERAN